MASTVPETQNNYVKFPQQINLFSGILAPFDYLPWANTKISLQYVAYNKFNGAKTNYDGSGRDASDNNSIYLQFWFLF